MRLGAARIGLHSGWDLEDPGSWSGVVTPMVAALARHAALDRLPAGMPRDALPDRVTARLSRRRVLPAHRLATARRRSRALSRAVDGADVDLVLAIASSTDLVLPLGRPVVQITDATFHGVQDFYPLFTGLGPGSVAQGRRVERLSARRSSHIVVATDWARSSLVSDVGYPSERITVAPFGPAIPAPDHATPRPDASTLRMLLVASDWERKDGAAALEILRRVRERRAATLTIVGAAPAGLPDGARALGRVDRDRLSGLYGEHHLLLEPARANASGVVITDALTHGLPVLAAEVGGVRTLVRPGIGGWLVPRAEVVPASAEILARVRAEDLAAASRSARADARGRLSWETWSRTVADLEIDPRDRGPGHTRAREDRP